MSLTNEMLMSIEKELQDQVSRVLDQPAMDSLHEMMAYHLGWMGEKAGKEARGKRIRPLLVTLCTAASGGNWQKALPAAAAVELIHNFSLIHDDIEDRSPTRRGRPTVWKLWGIPQAINTGDSMLSLAHLAIFDLQGNFSPRIVLKCSNLLQHTCLELTQGQFLDIAYEQHNSLSIDAYWQMISGKTAALIACCCKIGALLSKAPTKIVNACYDFGRNLGLAFQLLDDNLGIWGTEAQTGKSTESDLVSGKKTLPVLYALSLGKEFKNRWGVSPVKLDEINLATEILLEEGARDFTQRHANELTEKALIALDQAQPRGQAGLELSQLAHSLLSRIN